MDPAQFVSVILGIVLVVLSCLAWAIFYGSGWETVAGGVAGASVVVGIFAVVLALIVSILWGKK